uniref:Glycosyltransferase family 14 protein n=1 Tax=Brassica campestris TaxID=3711 RepID=M4EQ90_BRACM
MEKSMSHGHKFSSSMGYANMEKKWVFSLLIASLVCGFLIVTYFNMSLLLSSLRPPIIETSSHSKVDNLPRFAYLVSGSKGDLESLWRTLRALYHPRNQYIVHMDLESPFEERLELASRVSNDSMYSKIGNVYMITKANLVSYTGPTMVANTLHACAILLKRSPDWDWFINLSASDYPLVTQDGSAWMVLSRPFVEYIIWGWDNLPRTLLMYYTNFVSSPEFYFHTIICNVPEFSKTALNHDLHYIAWHRPPRQHPRLLSLTNMRPMIASGAAFARKFSRNDSALDRIDKELLMRTNQEGFTPGGWCGGKPECSVVEDVARINPGSGAERLKGLVDRLVSEAKSGKSCGNVNLLQWDKGYL